MSPTHRTTWMFALGATMAVTSGCGSDKGGQSNEPTGSDQSALYRAPIDTDHPFAVGVCIGALNTDPAKGEVGSCARTGQNVRCTGTLVAPNLVLTAKHCLYELVEGPPEGNPRCEYHFGSLRSQAGSRITLSHTVLNDHPVWVETSRFLAPTSLDFCKDDIAYLVLEKNIDGVKLPKLDLFRDIHARPPADGKVTIVGRGLFTPTDDGNLERRILRNIPYICADAPCDLSWNSGQSIFHVVDGQFAFGQSVDSGDSGSGVLLNDTFDSDPTVVGVESNGLEDPIGVPSHGIAIGLHRHATFLRRGAYLAANLGNYPVPGWAR
ncbi:trypsin-like serine peptidase [Pendulispora albinea]|uniref:Serine protease n=1 Tax=Pendulispora albinea TaxID=2741071 RepID=A0ABZ2LWF7_9BACT